jgi:hypothetical protein
MEKPDALAHFRGDAGYNCAQAVLKAFAPATGVDEPCLERFAKLGGGRAPGGECGALFAAKAILCDVAAKQEVEAEFVGIAKSAKCRDILSSRRVSCEQCVQTAADAVFGRLKADCSVQRPSTCTA